MNPMNKIMSIILAKFEESYGRKPSEEEVARLQQMAIEYAKQHQLKQEGPQGPQGMKSPGPQQGMTHLDMMPNMSKLGTGGIIRSVGSMASMIPMVGPVIGTAANVVGGVMEDQEEAHALTEENANRMLQKQNSRVGTYQGGGPLMQEYMGGTHESGNDIPVDSRGTPNPKNPAAVVEGGEMVMRSDNEEPAEVMSDRLEVINEKGEPETFAYNTKRILRSMTGASDIERRGARLYKQYINAVQDNAREISNEAENFLNTQDPTNMQEDVMMSRSPLSNYMQRKKSNDMMGQISEGVATNRKGISGVNENMEGLQQMIEQLPQGGGQQKEMRRGGGIEKAEKGKSMYADMMGASNEELAEMADNFRFGQNPETKAMIAGKLGGLGATWFRATEPYERQPEFQMDRSMGDMYYDAINPTSPDRQISEMTLSGNQARRLTDSTNVTPGQRLSQYRAIGAKEADSKRQILEQNQRERNKINQVKAAREDSIAEKMNEERKYAYEANQKNKAMRSDLIDNAITQSMKLAEQIGEIGYAKDKAYWESLIGRMSYNDWKDMMTQINPDGVKAIEDNVERKIDEAKEEGSDAGNIKEELLEQLANSDPDLYNNLISYSLREFAKIADQLGIKHPFKKPSRDGSKQKSRETYYGPSQYNPSNYGLE